MRWCIDNKFSLCNKFYFNKTYLKMGRSIDRPHIFLRQIEELTSAIAHLSISGEGVFDVLFPLFRQNCAYLWIQISFECFFLP